MNTPKPFYPAGPGRPRPLKVYVSLPISGRDPKEVEARCLEAAASIRRRGHTPVTPLEASPDRGASYAEHMGRDLHALLLCDAILLLPGWEQSKGCLLESYAACLYGLRPFRRAADLPDPEGGKEACDG